MIEGGMPQYERENREAEEEEEDDKPVKEEEEEGMAD